MTRPTEQRLRVSSGSPVAANIGRAWSVQAAARSAAIALCSTGDPGAAPPGTTRPSGPLPPVRASMLSIASGSRPRYDEAPKPKRRDIR